MIEVEQDCTCILDEATRGVSGSPLIPTTILEKIRQADIFIADITTICVDPATGKSIPNPNVVFELGYALAYLGWNRIVMLYNESIAPFENLPFDFNQNRISKYKIPMPNAKVRQSEKFGVNLKVFVETVIVANPPRPRELEGRSVEEINYQRDIATISRLFSNVAPAMIFNHIDMLPQHKFYSAAHASDLLEAFLMSSSTSFHDAAILPILEKVSLYLKRTLAADNFYGQLNVRTGAQSLQHNHNPQFAQARATELAKQEKARRKLQKSMSNLVSYVHNTFATINLDELGRLAMQKFRTETGYPR